MRRLMIAALVISIMMIVAGYGRMVFAQNEQSDRGNFLGRWDLTIYEPSVVYPSWIEIMADGGQYVGRFGNARPIDEVTIAGSDIHIAVKPQYESRDDDLVFEGTLFGDDVLRGSFLDQNGNWVYFSGNRAPELPAPSSVTWGSQVELLAGGLSDNWHPRHEGNDGGWTIENGILANTPPTADLVSNREFTNFKLHLEYTMEEDSNSGVYLRGRYEVQLLDSFGNAPGVLENAAVYGFVAPSRQTINPAGQWNELDITLSGRMLTVVLNGVMVLDDYEIPGITGGALDSNEAAPGPLMLQGDHGPVKFRNIIVWPAE